ncbi:MAG TPA: CDP-alcohol phosphatidyltransferase family protein [Bacteroidota bacterium]|nr:CDP-alcohol phosphatidyltransferase family protein [Bacteroidota bacterium]
MSTPPQQSGSPPGTTTATVDRFFTISNLLSVSRALLAIPFVLVMLSEYPSARMWGGLIMFVAALTDKYDGVLARKFNQTTEWGKILDPLADKIAVGAVVLVLLHLHDIPLWLVVVVLGRDILIFIGGMYIKATRGVVLPSNETGKWAVGIISLTLFLMVLDLHSWVIDVLLCISVLLLALSFVLYIKRFIEVLKQRA